MLEKGISGEYIGASVRLASLRRLSCFSSVITDHLALIEVLFRSEQYAEYKTAGAEHDAWNGILYRSFQRVDMALVHRQI